MREAHSTSTRGMLTLGDGVCPGLMAVVAQIPVVVPPEGMSWF
jgi:hypothetical protein